MSNLYPGRYHQNVVVNNEEDESIKWENKEKITKDFLERQITLVIK